MVGTPEEMARHFEQQAQAPREQLDMIHAEQESIDTLKQMLSQLLEDKKKNPKAKTPPKNFWGRRKEEESSSSAHTEDEEHSTLNHLRLHMKRRLIQRTRVLILIR